MTTMVVVNMVNMTMCHDLRVTVTMYMGVRHDRGVRGVFNALVVFLLEVDFSFYAFDLLLFSLKLIEVDFYVVLSLVLYALLVELVKS